MCDAQDWVSDEISSCSGMNVAGLAILFIGPNGRFIWFERKTVQAIEGENNVTKVSNIIKSSRETRKLKYRGRGIHEMFLYLFFSALESRGYNLWIGGEAFHNNGLVYWYI